MMKIHLIWFSMFIAICLSSAFFKPSLIEQQFTLRSLGENDLQSNLYQPLKINTGLIEESFYNDEVKQSLSSTLTASAKILSDLLLTKLSGEKIIAGEKIKCGNTFLTQIIQNENIDADIAIFAISTLEENKIISSTKCEAIDSKFIKAIVLEINVELFSKFEKNSQLKEICIEISNVLYENNEERKIFAIEIDEYLNKGEKIGKLKAGSCVSGQENCIECENIYSCLLCDPGYFPQPGHCDTCPGTDSSVTCSQCDSNCSSCKYSADNCWICADNVHMSPPPTCSCPSNSVQKGKTCVCNKGYYFSSNTICRSCASNCATCSGSASNCITCSDALHMSAAPACACPQNTHILAGRCVSDKEALDLSSD